jgi:hypothetical protein
MAGPALLRGPDFKHSLANESQQGGQSQSRSVKVIWAVKVRLAAEMLRVLHPFYAKMYMYAVPAGVEWQPSASFVSVRRRRFDPEAVRAGIFVVPRFSNQY